MTHLSETTLDWIRHSIGLTEAVLKMSDEAYRHAYPNTPRQFHVDKLAGKRSALAALQSGAPMTDTQQRTAGFLLTYADAHIRFYGSDRTAFETAMAGARRMLTADSERQAA